MQASRRRVNHEREVLPRSFARATINAIAKICFSAADRSLLRISPCVPINLIFLCLKSTVTSLTDRSYSIRLVVYRATRSQTAVACSPGTTLHNRAMRSSGLLKSLPVCQASISKMLMPRFSCTFRSVRDRMISIGQGRAEALCDRFRFKRLSLAILKFVQGGFHIRVAFGCDRKFRIEYLERLKVLRMTRSGRQPCAGASATRLRQPTASKMPHLRSR